MVFKLFTCRNTRSFKAGNHGVKAVHGHFGAKPSFFGGFFKRLSGDGVNTAFFINAECHILVSVVIDCSAGKVVYGGKADTFQIRALQQG